MEDDGRMSTSWKHPLGFESNSFSFNSLMIDDYMSLGNLCIKIWKETYEQHFYRDILIDAVRKQTKPTPLEVN